MLTSTVCRYEHFLSDWYAEWTRLLEHPVEVTPSNQLSYRKLWEYAAIIQTLTERDMLRPGRTGLGFAVGREPLPSVFAQHGVRVVATDLMEDQVNPGWVSSGQHASSLEALYWPNLIDRKSFDELVSFQFADMNKFQINEKFDFLWSSCAFEHLGSLDLGLVFVEKAMQLLKPGGIAVHTTEYNVGSDEATVMSGHNCIYRKRDLEGLDRRLRRIGCGIERMDFDAGTHPYDLTYDIAPYFQSGRVHLKLEVDGHICTSFLVIAHKGE